MTRAWIPRNVDRQTWARCRNRAVRTLIKRHAAEYEQLFKKAVRKAQSDD